MKIVDHLFLQLIISGDNKFFCDVSGCAGEEPKAEEKFICIAHSVKCEETLQVAEPSDDIGVLIGLEWLDESFKILYT